MRYLAWESGRRVHSVPTCLYEYEAYTCSAVMMFTADLDTLFSSFSKLHSACILTQHAEQNVFPFGPEAYMGNFQYQY